MTISLAPVGQEAAICSRRQKTSGNNFAIHFHRLRVTHSLRKNIQMRQPDL